MQVELRSRLTDFSSRVEIVTDSYANMRQILHPRKVNGVLLDLGFNSVHVDEGDRGFSFLLDGPLDMRYDQSSGITAADLINELDSPFLCAIFTQFSGESIRTCRHVANAIVSRRQSKGQFTSTKELAGFLNHLLMGGRPKKKNVSTTPCTGLFQALRIAVNNEFQHLDSLMSDLPFILEKGGVFIALCFQSLEIRRLKTWVRWYLDGDSEWRKTHLLEDQAVGNSKTQNRNCNEYQSCNFNIQLMYSFQY